MHMLDRAPFGRILPAMITPMKEDGSVDYAAAAALARHLVVDGADGLVLNGTTGESPVTHVQEKVDLVKAVKDAVDVPVVSGAGSNDTAHTVRMAQAVQQAGADALLIVMPYYSRPSQEGVIKHYAAVDAVADKPIIVYDVPSRTGLHVQLSTYRRLAQLSHVVAVKDATGDLPGALRKRLATGLAWYSGDDGLFLPFLSIGAVGIVSVVAHVASGPMQELVEAYDAGQARKARELAGRLAPLVEALDGTGEQAVMAKAALTVKRVIPSSAMRLPNVSPGPEQIERATRGLQAARLL